MEQHPTRSPAPLDALSPDTRAALREALARYAASPDDGIALREPLRAVAAEARARQMGASELLVGFKALWRSLPAVRELEEPDGRAMLERLVTACIEEYYRR